MARRRVTRQCLPQVQSSGARSGTSALARLRSLIAWSGSKVPDHVHEYVAGAARMRTFTRHDEAVTTVEFDVPRHSRVRV